MAEPKKWYERYPIRQKAVWAGVVLILANVLTGLGIASSGFLLVANAAIGIATLVGLVTSAEGSVTPVADPKATDGEPLIRADQAPELVEWDHALRMQAIAEATRFHPAGSRIESEAWYGAPDVQDSTRKVPAQKRARPKKAAPKKAAARKKPASK